MSIASKCRRALSFVMATMLGVVGCGEETILHGLKERQANQARLALSEGGINVSVSKATDGWNINVPTKSVHEAIRRLERRHLLGRFERSRPAPSGSMFETQSEREARLESLRAADIEETLQSLPGVVDARVHILTQSTPALLGTEVREQRSATAVLILDGEVARDQQRLKEQQIRELIQSAAGVRDAIVFLHELNLSHHDENVLKKDTRAASDTSLSAHRRDSSLVKIPAKQLSLAIALCAVLCIGGMLVRGRKRAHSKNGSPPAGGAHDFW